MVEIGGNLATRVIQPLPSKMNVQGWQSKGDSIRNAEASAAQLQNAPKQSHSERFQMFDGSFCFLKKNAKVPRCRHGV